MTLTSTEAVVAAGVVCWREEKGRLRVLVVHRAARADVSLPKGKVDPGESLPEAAVRETFEETGVAVALGAPLGVTEYSLTGGRRKIVHYWAAEASEESVAASVFSANEEIAAIEWLPLRVARERLSYDRDRELLDRFSERSETGRHRTFAIIALRHAKAVPPGSWPGPDSTRPLEPVGLAQARSAARAIAAYSPTKIISSTAVRCVSTVEPLSVLTGLDVKATSALSQDAHEEGAAQVYRVVTKRVAKREPVVLCSHGPVLPDIIDEIADAAGSDRSSRLRRASLLAVGEFAVVHLSRADPAAGIVAIETHAPVVE